MSSFFSFVAKKKFPNSDTRHEILSGPFTVLKGMIYALFLATLIIGYLILIQLNNTLLRTIPAHGGSLTEGIIGSPRFINPILAATETDVSLTHLIYAGLIKEHADGTLEPELAESYQISPDGRVYTFTLRNNIFFHDGTPVTSSDVAFTLEKLQDPDLNDRDSLYWQMINAETPDQRTIILSLMIPDTNFLHKMTVGILPAARWQGVVDEAFVDPSLNLNPIGAGPFKLDDMEFNGNGAPTEITLSRSKNYPLGNAFLKNLNLTIYANQSELQNALKNGSIDYSFAVDPTTFSDKPSQLAIMQIPTDTKVQLVRRSNETVFQNPAFLSAINHFIDKGHIIATVENGYGIPETDSALSFDETIRTLGNLGYIYSDGTLYKSNVPVTFALATEKEPDLIAVSQDLVDQLKRLGISVTVEIYDQGTFHDGVSQSQFPLLLVDSSIPLPDTYTNGFSLYTKAILLTAQDTVHGIQYDELPARTARYDTVNHWFTKTDRVWKFLTSND